MSGLPEFVQAMLEPRAYPMPVRKIELGQTQMSFLFLTDEYVYKVKKPVNLGYLDYTTLEKRRFFCQKEVELNRRLCPDTYLGVVSIVRAKGGYLVEGRGRAMEYAVKMRRLPGDAMMSVLLPEDRVTPQMIADLAEKLAEFHRSAATSPEISAFGDLDTINVNTAENFSQTEKYVSRTVSQKKYEHVKEYTERFIRDNASLFRRRMTDGRIRDCHGDLHAAHICFSDGICIYDCIEFNDRFRYCDVASEIAFLAMDLDHYGRADLSRRFIDAYVEESQDAGLKKLLNFYKCYRAYVRGKVEGFKLDDPYISGVEKEKVRDVASSYFDLAHAYTRSKPLLLITTGLVGTGKSTVAQALAKRLGVVVISSDVTRKQLAGIPTGAHRFEDFDKGIYSGGFSRITYDKMFDMAKGVLSDGGSVILDASFIKSAERMTAKKLAEAMNAGFFIIECTLTDEIVRQRLSDRLKRGSVSDGRWEIFGPQRSMFDPVAKVPAANHITVDTSQPLDNTVRNILDRID